MAAPPRLRHLHLPSIHPHYVPYSLANRVQEHLRRQHLDFKDGGSAASPPPPPPPTLISFSPSPIYTLGRRQTAPLTAPEVARLTAPLQIPIPPSQGRSPKKNASKTPSDASVSIRPQLLHSPRGGLTTYHGPGQVVLWPVLDLRSPHHRHFTVKCYARLLESTTIATLRLLFGLDAFTTTDPGVWLSSSASAPPFQPQPQSRSEPHQPPAEQPPSQTPSQPPAEDSLAKIAALGVHLRRHVTALGTAINISTPPPSAGEDNNNETNDEHANPWARIVACGLAGRGVTSVAREVTSAGVEERLASWSCSSSSSLGSGGGGGGGDGDGSREGVVARAWAGELAGRIGLGPGLGEEEGGAGVEVVEPGEVVRLMEELVVAAGEGGEEVDEERGYLERVRKVVAGC